ncbi:UvrD-helicase domain-containing protein [Solibacillus ferritrahens]|uniref:UvrD-helicase domain-containing protein n=1 Tax=Solibacillus ferritrahens TaxID=3098620 RepID=UPI00300BDC49
MIEITDKDIDSIQEILLPNGLKFDDNHSNIIKNLQSVDIIACPGSGKTTTLIAKLLILESKLPFGDNRGICVLTHTNVGVNEIKNRSIKNGNGLLFQYPNHISRIQVFINKYLVIPGFKYYYKRNIESIDNEYYEQMFKRKYYQNIPPKFRRSIEHKYSVEDLVNKLKFEYATEELLIGNQKLTDKYKETTQTYQLLKKLKLDMLAAGILSFDDTLYLSLKFIKEFPELKDLLSRRFKYLFIDEMQDTSAIQMEILEYCFDENMTVIQRIGDKNQSIFEEIGNNETWVLKDNKHNLNKSNRFSDNIAQCINYVCINPQNLKGNPYIKNIRPKILVYSNKTIQNVLPYFGSLIEKNNLYDIGNTVFKAVGYVTKKHDGDKITLPSYFEKYTKKQEYKIQYNSLGEYIIAIKKLETSNVNEARKLLVECILKCLGILGIKNGDYLFNEKTLIEVLLNKDVRLVPRFNLHLSRWILDIKNNLSVEAEIKDFIFKFIKVFEKDFHAAQLADFLGNTSGQEVDYEVENKLDYFEYKINTGEIFNIKLDSVHNVKGETHVATLYLETYYKKYDLAVIIDYLCGNHVMPTGKELKKFLSIVYVGLSRASHLLCIAMNKEHLQGKEKDLEEIGWDIIEVGEVESSPDMESLVGES